MSKKNKILGILWSDEKIVVSQLERSGRTFRLTKSGQFLLADKCKPENFSKDPSGFLEFMRDNGFKCDRAVVGLSGKHAVGTAMQMPPLKDMSMLPGILRFNLEKQTMLHSDDTLIDYSGTPGSAAGSIFVVSVLKKKIDAIKKVLLAARVKPVSLTLRVLAAEPSDVSGLTCQIVVEPGSTEIAVMQNGQIKTMRYIPLSVAGPSDVSVARKVSGEFGNLLAGQAASNTPVRVRLVNNSDHSGLRQAIADISDKIQFVEPDQQIDYGDCSGSCCLAADLALKYLSDEKYQIDLLNSHINDKKESSLRKYLPRAIAVAAILLAAIAYLILDWRSDVDAVASYKNQIELIAEEVKEAQNVIDRVSYARKWYDKTPRYLEDLKELTLLFPERGDVWLNSLAVDEEFDQVITGKAVEERAVLDVLNKIEQSEHFTNVKMLYIRQTAKNSEVVSFAINFQYGQGN
ncbi:MAG: PilN domain-containing protein [Anaerohalosphaera sp.]|nr:PilN domain-containing protein [Anaerohalosphaera sp.]